MAEKKGMLVDRCMSSWVLAKKYEAENRGEQFKLDSRMWFRTGTSGGDVRFPSLRIEEYLWEKHAVYVRDSSDYVFGKNPRRWMRNYGNER